MFALSAERLATNLAGDLHFMAGQAGISFEGQPKSWAEAAGRVGDIVERFARAATTAEGGARNTAAATEERAAARRRRDDEEGVEGSKIHFSANPKGTASAGALLQPLTSEAVRRTEAMATRGADELAEAWRLCTLQGDEVGRAAEAHLLSDGKHFGTLNIVGLRRRISRCSLFRSIMCV